MAAYAERGAVVTVESLKANGLATRKGIPVKILAKGELSKALTVNVHAVSASARVAIEQAGGTVQLIESTTSES